MLSEHERISVPANSVYAAKNLADIMPIALTGDVRMICSVLLLRSSLKSFMVKSGIKTVKDTSMVIK